MKTLLTTYYQQFDADDRRDIPAEGYGGWKTEDLPFEPEHTALAVMHAWDWGTRFDYPGWYRAVEYIPRAETICQTVFPKLLSAVRQSAMQVFHIVRAGSYYRDYPGYHRAVSLADPEPTRLPDVEPTAGWKQLRAFRKSHVFVGTHNREDVDRGFRGLDFHPQARPEGEEGIAENRVQLLALSRYHHVNHLVYVGFALDGCLLLSPGGMNEMAGAGLLCSTIPQAVTAIENRETARTEASKHLGLWRVALLYGFLYDLDDFLRALQQ